MKKMKTLLTMLAACTTLSLGLVGCSDNNYTAQPLGGNTGTQYPNTGNYYPTGYNNQVPMNNQFYNQPMYVPATANFQAGLQASVAFSAGFQTNAFFSPTCYNWAWRTNSCISRTRAVYTENNCACHQSVSVCDCQRAAARYSLTRKERRKLRKAIKKLNKAGFEVVEYVYVDSSSSREPTIDDMPDAPVPATKTSSTASTTTPATKASVDGITEVYPSIADDLANKTYDGKALYERLRKTTDNEAGLSPNKTGKFYSCHIETKKAADNTSQQITLCDFHITLADFSLWHYQAKNSRSDSPIATPPLYGTVTGETLNFADKNLVKVGIDGLRYEEGIVKLTFNDSTIRREATAVFNSPGLSAVANEVIKGETFEVKQNSQFKCYRKTGFTAVDCVIKIDVGTGETMNLN